MMVSPNPLRKAAEKRCHAIGANYQNRTGDLRFTKPGSSNSRKPFYSSVKRSPRIPLPALLPSLLPIRRTKFENRPTYGHFWRSDRCKAIGGTGSYETLAGTRECGATPRHRRNDPSEASRAAIQVRDGRSPGGCLRRVEVPEVGWAVEGAAQRRMGRGRVRHTQDRSLGSSLRLKGGL